MADFRLVISDPKTGKAYKLELSGAKANKLVGKVIGDIVEGQLVGLSGYKLLISGGSDKDGVAMRRDLPGAARKRLLLSSGTGYRAKSRGVRKRKSIRGHEISVETGQVNLKVIETGSKPLDEIIETSVEAK
jgi:small subunit ribosomal protein S6e